MKTKQFISSFLILGLMLTACQTTEVSETESTEDSTLHEVVETEFTSHEESSDYTWDSKDEIAIDLNEISESVYEITEGGVYRLSGDFEGQIKVSADEEVVQFILDSVNISGIDSSAIFVDKSEKTIVILADGSENKLSDTEDYEFESPDEDEPNATLFSKSDLTIYSDGSGSLSIEANYNDAIGSKDGLILAQANLEVTAVDDGIRGKDYVVLENVNVLVNATGDGIKSDGANDLSTGVIEVNGGTVVVNADQDAIVAEKVVNILNGEITLTAGGGSSNSIDTDQSQKGIKATELVSISGGSLSISSADDALHSNGDLQITGGEITLSSGDDGVHADSDVEITDGTLVVSKSYEGVEGGNITISGGVIDITASDDGLNVAGGSDESGFGRPGQGDFSSVSGDHHLALLGGEISIDSGGDGLDSNGTAEMTAGTVIVNGPVNDGNGALDFNGGFEVSGGLLIAVGSSGMAEAPEESSSQYSLRVNFDSQQSAGTEIRIQSSTGEQLLTFVPEKQFQSIVYSSPEIENGETYTVYLNDAEVTSLTIESMVTSYGSTGFGGGMGGGFGPGMNGDFGDRPEFDGTMPDRMDWE